MMIELELMGKVSNLYQVLKEVMINKDVVASGFIQPFGQALEAIEKPLMSRHLFRMLSVWQMMF
ncbi:hypothetical protein LR48_Vigan07g177200 [Vigna angularis]|uniref:Uncharacterized protein n=1 Tax=Phaseolus angularis TaxID=3914 RepID=A0A0L9UZ72_PHAAN|nr:hypothetical protein LR48_Vigan07g177200 [Vigna angularis]